MHVLNWIPWVMVAGFIARYWPLGRVHVALLAWGYGAITHILWEEGEYLAFVQAIRLITCSAAGGLVGTA